MIWPWSELGLPGPSDLSAIKHAYAQRLKEVHPEEDPEGFQRLHAAYRAACRDIKSSSRTPAPTPEAAFTPPGEPEAQPQPSAPEGADYDRVFLELEREQQEKKRLQWEKEKYKEERRAAREAEARETRERPRREREAAFRQRWGPLAPWVLRIMRYWKSGTLKSFLSYALLPILLIAVMAFSPRPHSSDPQPSQSAASYGPTERAQLCGYLAADFQRDFRVISTELLAKDTIYKLTPIDEPELIFQAVLTSAPFPKRQYMSTYPRRLLQQELKKAGERLSLDFSVTFGSEEITAISEFTPGAVRDIYDLAVTGWGEEQAVTELVTRLNDVIRQSVYRDALLGATLYLSCGDFVLYRFDLSRREIVDPEDVVAEYQVMAAPTAAMTALAQYGKQTPGLGKNGKWEVLPTVMAGGRVYHVVAGYESKRDASPGMLYYVSADFPQVYCRPFSSAGGEFGVSVGPEDFSHEGGQLLPSGGVISVYQWEDAEE